MLGLTIASVILTDAAPPVFLLPFWATGLQREYMCSWGLCEVHRRTLGDDDARRQVGRAVERLEEVG